jgi:hypothetical protein
MSEIGGDRNGATLALEALHHVGIPAGLLPGFLLDHWLAAARFSILRKPLAVIGAP